VDRNLAPTLAHEDISRVDLQQLGDYVTKLAQSGMPLFPNPELESFLLDSANLPESESIQLDGLAPEAPMEGVPGEQPPQPVSQVQGQPPQAPPAA